MIKTARSASVLRKRLSDLAVEIHALVRQVVEPRVMFRGTVYLSRQRCGKTGCRCAQGDLHQAWIASMSIGTKRTTRSVPPPILDRVRELAATYARFRAARIKLRKALATLDRAMRGLETAVAKNPFVETRQKGGRR